MREIAIRALPLAAAVVIGATVVWSAVPPPAH
jgi:hypothetical protein